MNDPLSLASAYPALVTATGAIIVALVTAISAFFATKRDRRRQLYGEAYKAALSWREMLYRVRRRAQGKETELVDRFHDIQEQIDYFSGWIGSESRWLQRSYLRLVGAIKSETKDLIQTAWENEPTPEVRQSRSLVHENHPNLANEADRFLLDVRSHLSPLQFRKVAVVWRNRKWLRKASK